LTSALELLEALPGATLVVDRTARILSGKTPTPANG